MSSSTSAERPTTVPVLAEGIVRLRSWRHDDASELVAACNDEELARWLDRLPQPYTEGDAHEYVDFCARGWAGEGDESSLCVADTDTDRPLGSCGIFWRSPEHGVAEVGYWVRRDARGRGVATRAVRLVAHYVLGDLGYERLELRADPRNGASCRVAERAGFTHEGVLRSTRTHARTGERHGYAVYSMLRSEL